MLPRFYCEKCNKFEKRREVVRMNHKSAYGERYAVEFACKACSNEVISSTHALEKLIRRFTESDEMLKGMQSHLRDEMRLLKVDVQSKLEKAEEAAFHVDGMLFAISEREKAVSAKEKQLNKSRKTASKNRSDKK